MVADSTDYPIVREFFELFKIPWELAVPSRKYPVILSTMGQPRHLNADQFLLYGSEQLIRRSHAVRREEGHPPLDLEWSRVTLPIYGRLALFERSAASRLAYRTRAVDHRDASSGVRRVGYDLFREVHHLLTKGQPASRASIPTLELHIALLRQLLLEAGMAFIEVPPRPTGYDFICCLTHDVDFYGIRRHKFDRTLFGLAGRATVGSLVDLVRGRRTIDEVARNWSALVSLPLVHLGLLQDFWRPFEDYAQAEDPCRSTFFLAPFKERPGIAPDGTTDPRRGVPYEIREISGHARRAIARGDELAVHGIDAWSSSEAGHGELGVCPSNSNDPRDLSALAV